MANYCGNGGYAQTAGGAAQGPHIQLHVQPEGIPGPSLRPG